MVIHFIENRENYRKQKQQNNWHWDMKWKNLKILHSWNIFSREAVCRVRNEHARLSNSTITNNNTLDRTTLSHYCVADDQVLYCPVPNRKVLAIQISISPQNIDSLLLILQTLSVCKFLPVWNQSWKDIDNTTIIHIHYFWWYQHIIWQATQLTKESKKLHPWNYQYL